MLVPPISTARMLSWPSKIHDGARCRQPIRPASSGSIADRHQIDLDALGFEDEVGARDRQLADAALAKAAADHDALGVGPRLGLEEAPRHIGELLREFLDRAMHQGGGFDVVADQHLVELRSCRSPPTASRRADRRRSSAAACAAHPGFCGTRPCWRGRRGSLSSSFSSML